MKLAYIVVCVIAAIMLTCGVVAQHYLEDLSYTLSAYATAGEAAIYAQDWESALVSLDQLIECLSNHAPTVEVMLNHARVEDIMCAAVSAKAYILTRGRQDAYAQVALLKQACEYIGKIEKFTLTNIL